MSVHDRWRGARTGKGKRWETRWRDPTMQQRKRRFDTRSEAEAFEARLRTGAEAPLAHQSKRLTVDQLMDGWLATTTGLRPATQTAYRLDAGEATRAFGDRLASAVRPSEVRTWAARAHPGASIRRRSLMALRRAYRLAVADRILTVDPTDGCQLPKLVRGDMRFLTWGELGTLASVSGRYGPLVWVLGTCGLRLSEALALDAGDVDRTRRRLRVRRSKTGRPRDVPISGFVLDMLPTEGPLLTGRGGVRLNGHNWRERNFRPAARAAGLGEMHPHELRHTAASLAIASGADVKAVQRMLGHASAAMTLDLYGHLFDQQLDTVAVRMDEARLASNVVPIKRLG